MSLQQRANRVIARPESFVIGDVIGLITELRDNQRDTPVSKPKSIELLEAEVARLEAHNQTLLETNTAYLLRARAAEDKLKELDLV